MELSRTLSFLSIGSHKQEENRTTKDLSDQMKDLELNDCLVSMGIAKKVIDRENPFGLKHAIYGSVDEKKLSFLRKSFGTDEMMRIGEILVNDGVVPRGNQQSLGAVLLHLLQFPKSGTNSYRKIIIACAQTQIKAMEIPQQLIGELKANTDCFNLRLKESLCRVNERSNSFHKKLWSS
nr:MAG: hypothetical protein [Halyomorpha halys orthomyxo-like virus 1]